MSTAPAHGEGEHIATGDRPEQVRLSSSESRDRRFVSQKERI
ncbi:hypothetical protein ABZT04_26850 [Streptomyces sp. NPDC005492]